DYQSLGQPGRVERHCARNLGDYAITLLAISGTKAFEYGFRVHNLERQSRARREYARELSQCILVLFLEVEKAERIEQDRSLERLRPERQPPHVPAHP